ncbi:sulfite exporter TauE/SafE family protein [Salipiger sp. P9]|uniref:sulfite exporter TauE/SafE family protein n=1 Tax=Salipiger pentaromativorans TaxID=2943193 RepID=UPI002157CB90|nr:sulfite exporter TauE/SafE family protein [Salipiger pentaromativorans]MCR8547700.1 sulfite exporter TauE/SafE family protein [Salipiger pentaromativorans]
MFDLSTLLPLVGLLVVTSAFAGLIAGLLGVGGGIVLVPAFLFTFETLGYGSPQVMQICLATSLATIIVTSMRSVLSHNKKGAVEWPILRAWAPGIAVGALIGVMIAARLRSDFLQALFGCIAIGIGLYFAFGRRHWRLSGQMPTGVLRAALSPMVGFLSVLMGIGGGSFAVPLMTLCSVPMHRAVATAAGFGVLIAVPSVLAFLFVPVPAEVRPPATLGSVNIGAFAIAISMTLITAPLGAKLAHSVEEKTLRRAFAVFILAVALNMLRKALF